MTVGDWLSARDVAAPAPQLSQRVRALLGVASAQDAAAAPDVFADAAERALRGLFEKGDNSRTIAHDLLAIDALVTYACEAAADQWAEDPERLAQWCEDLVGRVSRLAPAAG